MKYPIQTEKKNSRHAACLMVTALLLTASLSACSDHDDMYDAGMRVGNILLADNTMVPPEMFAAGTMTPVGVVFYASGDTAMAVAPEELGDFCFSLREESVSGASEDSYSLNGLVSTAALLVSGYDTPAARACTEYRSPLSGWFLPSAGELRVMSGNLPVIQRSMEVIGGQGFGDVQYMSSSEDNSSPQNAQVNCYCVSLLRGYAVSVPKKEPHRVRPVILIH